MASEERGFDRLRTLLLADERDARESIGGKVDDLGARLDRLPADLPDVIDEAGNRDSRLVRALEKPLAEGLARLVKRDKELFITLLFPIIGPLIRRSIAETMSSLLKDLNRTLEYSVSAKGLKWRIEALRSGVPFAQVVLKHSLRYRIEHLFLVDSHSGLLLAHSQHLQAQSTDQDAVAGMLTAISDFARDAVLRDENEGLHRIELGDSSMQIMRGPLAYLAVVVRGELSDPVRMILRQWLEKTHAVEGLNVDADAHREELDQELEELISEHGVQAAEVEESAPKKPWLAIGFIAAVLLPLLTWWGYVHWRNLQGADLQTRLVAEPGYAQVSVIL
jgi:hypothetical protein